MLTNRKTKKEKINNHFIKELKILKINFNELIINFKKLGLYWSIKFSIYLIILITLFIFFLK